MTCFVAFKTLSHYRASVWSEVGADSQSNTQNVVCEMTYIVSSGALNSTRCATLDGRLLAAWLSGKNVGL